MRTVQNVHSAAVGWNAVMCLLSLFGHRMVQVQGFLVDVLSE